MSSEDPVCPYCGKPLVYRDSRPRIWKWYGGVKREIIIRRLKCNSCCCLHSELPDKLVPHKHYGAEVIEDVVDEVSTPDETQTEDYPCEKTMERWKNWIASNTPQIDGFLKSVGTRFLDMQESLLLSTDSLLTKLRDNGPNWLATIIGIIYRAGGALLTSPPVRMHAPDLSVCPGSHDVSSSQKEDTSHEKGYKRRMAGRGSPAAV